eukprot:TRINITY_DN754_c0_g1_i1.p1 TRINITY_DN754_c0_g1~~TRINITY_DN754_c0_g1_i1.p1  ORF type:complete len:619 (+),score=231.17 TRINITY_DN754_c0_g1_i1:173-2029(+)
MCIRDRACVAWVNKQIVPLGYPEIESLETGFSTGITLGGLIEAYCGRKLKLHKAVGITAVRLDNLTICCEFLDHLRLKNRMTVAADFHDGCTKRIVPFILKLDGKFAAKAAKGGEAPAPSMLPAAATSPLKAAKPVINQERVQRHWRQAKGGVKAYLAMLHSMRKGEAADPDQLANASALAQDQVERTSLSASLLEEVMQVSAESRDENASALFDDVQDSELNEMLQNMDSPGGVDEDDIPDEAMLDAAESLSSARADCSSLALQLEMTQIELLTSQETTEDQAARLIRLQAKESLLRAQYEVFRHSRVLCEYRANHRTVDPAEYEKLEIQHMEAVRSLYTAAEECPFAMIVELRKGPGESFGFTLSSTYSERNENALDGITVAGSDEVAKADYTTVGGISPDGVVAKEGSLAPGDEIVLLNHQAEFDRMDLTAFNLELVVLKADMGDMSQAVGTMQALLADISKVEHAQEDAEEPKVPPDLAMIDNMKAGLLAVIGASVKGATTKDDVTFYVVEVSTYDLKTEQALTWEVERRYSQFEKLHKKLEHMGWNMPSMPPSKIFGARNFNTVEERKIAFAAILEAMTGEWQKLTTQKSKKAKTMPEYLDQVYHLLYNFFWD